MTRTQTEMINDKSERAKSQLENDNEHHCRACGIELSHTAFTAGYERCPECYLEETKEELEFIFGSLNSVEAAPTHSAESHLVVATEDVLGGHLKVFDDARVEFIPDYTGRIYLEYLERDRDER